MVVGETPLLLGKELMGDGDLLLSCQERSARIVQQPRIIQDRDRAAGPFGRSRPGERCEGGLELRAKVTQAIRQASCTP